MSGVKDTDLGFRRVLDELAQIGKPVVLVGIREQAGSQVAPRRNGKPGSATVAAAAAMNEFGTDKIPARPAFRTAVDANRQAYADGIQRAVERAVDGSAPLEQGLSLVGLAGVRDVQRSIINWTTPPNAPSTIRRKKGVNNPLTDTGRTRQSVDFEVRLEGHPEVGS